MNTYISNAFTLKTNEVMESIINSTNTVDTNITVSVVDHAILKLMKTTSSPRKTKNVGKSSKPSRSHGEYQKRSNTSSKNESNLHQTPSYSYQLPYPLGVLNMALGALLSCVITVISQLFKVTVKLIQLIVRFLRSEIVKSSLILLLYATHLIVSFMITIMFSKRSSTSY